MDEYFSNYIKELDEPHKAILEQLKQKREQLKQLQYQFYHEDESIAKELYVLRSMKEPDMERIRELEEKQKALPSKQQLQEQIDKIQKEIRELENKFTDLPFELPESTIVPHFSFQVDIDGLWIVNINGKYYVKENLDGSVLKNYKVEVNEDNLPIRLVWLKQDSDTRGIPLWFSRSLKIVNPVVENIKPVKREREVVEYVDKPIKIEKIIPSLQCSRCGWNLTDKMRLINCPNCGISLYDAIKMQIENEIKFENNKEKKKNKWKLFK